MHGSFKTQINPATSVKDPLPNNHIRQLARTLGRVRQDLADAVRTGDARSERTLALTKNRLERDLWVIARAPKALQANRTCAGRAVGAPAEVYEYQPQPSVLAAAATESEVHAR